jgi:hypothetical protein
MENIKLLKEIESISDEMYLISNKIKKEVKNLPDYHSLNRLYDLVNVLKSLEFKKEIYQEFLLNNN